jgi:iron complex outermembrane receptor protein
MQHFRSSSTIAAALGIAGLAAPLQAQEVLEEIIVTALKRAESLQDAPATVTAFDAETIEQARIQSMRDYVNLTSNMTLMETQNNAFAFVNIRGLAQIRNVDPTVAVVIDGVLSTTSLAFSQELYDIQQIEVLKGPQGALYGRNATGGAINITTKQPTTDGEVYVRGGVGNGDNLQFSSVASGPLGGDAVRGRVVVGYKEADGWRDNVATDVKADPYEDLTIAGKLLWDISEQMALDLRLTLSDTESTGSQFVSNAPNFVTGFPGNAQYPGNGTAPPVPGLPASITALVGDPNNTSIKHQGNEPGMDDREVVSLSAKFDWEVGLGTLSSITSFDTLDHVTVGEQFAYYPFVQVQGTTDPLHPAGVLVPPAAAALDDFGTGQNLTFGQNRFHDGFSQELRLTSPDDGACAGSAASTSRKPIST